jgi:hypothetical protein
MSTNAPSPKLPAIAMSLLLLGVLTGCPPPPGTGPTGPDTPDSGVDAGNDAGDDGAEGLESGWNPSHQLGPVLDALSSEIRTVDVALAPTGTTAWVVWDQVGDERASIWARSHAGDAWTPEVQLTPSGQNASGPRLALNDAGQAAVAYVVREVSGTGAQLGSAVWVTRLQDGKWSSPERLSPAAPEAPSRVFDAREPFLGIDGRGEVYVAWTQYDSAQSELRGLFLRHHDGTGWSEPQRLNEGTLPADLEGLGVSRDGRVVALWVQDTNAYDPGKPGGGPRIPNAWARTFDGSDWSAPVRIGPELVEFEGLERLKLAMDAEGRAFAIWEEHRLEQARIGAARFDPTAGGWAPPVTVASSPARTDHLSFISIATDALGNAMATWTVSVPDSDDEAGAASRFDHLSKTWSPPTEFTRSWTMDESRAAMGADGRSWALYTQPGDAGAEQLLARELSADEVWSEAILIGGGQISDAAGNAAGVVLAGSVRRWYSNTQPLMRTAPLATFHLP